MERSIFFQIVAAVVACLCAMDVAYACMCMPSHPQEALCSEYSYAALVKVRNMEYVYITERPKYKPPKTAEAIIQIEIPTSDEEELKKADGENDAAFEKDAAKQKGTEEMERVEVVVKDLGHLSQKHFVASNIRYRVKVYETYKGMKPEEMQGRKMYIYTAPDEGLCGTKLDTKQMYLILGRMDGDRLTVGLCDHVIPWTLLDPKQRRVVRRNMRSAPSICTPSCSVQTCPWTQCPKQEKNTCVWTSEMELEGMKLNVHPANYVCAKEANKQGGNCVWSDALGTNKRHRRRRRHHVSLRLRRHQESHHGLLP